jgi:hypothetical protein
MQKGGTLAIFDKKQDRKRRSKMRKQRVEQRATGKQAEKRDFTFKKTISI